jgi:hypothetical protein
MLTYSCPVPELWEGQACGVYPNTGLPSNLCCGSDATPGDSNTYSYQTCDMSTNAQVCSPDLRSCSEKYTNRAICEDGLDSKGIACVDCIFKGCNSNFYNVFPLDAKGNPVVPLDRSPHETCQIVTDFTSVGNLIGTWTGEGQFTKNTSADVTINCCHTGEDKYNSAPIACVDFANDPRVINSSTSRVGLWETTRCTPGMRLKYSRNTLNVGAFSAQPEARWNSQNTESSLWNHIKDVYGNNNNLDAHWNNPNFTLTRAAGCGDGNCE